MQKLKYMVQDVKPLALPIDTYYKITETDIIASIKYLEYILL